MSNKDNGRNFMDSARVLQSFFARRLSWCLSVPLAVSCGVPQENQKTQRTATTEVREYIAGGIDRVVLRDFEDPLRPSVSAFGENTREVSSYSISDPFRGEGSLWFRAQDIARQAVIHVPNLDEADLSQFDHFRFWARVAKGKVAVMPAFRDIDGEVWGYEGRFLLTEDYQEYRVELDPALFHKTHQDRISLEPNLSLDLHRASSFYLVLTDEGGSETVELYMDDIQVTKRSSGSTAAKTVGQGVDHTWVQETFPVSFEEVPVVLAAMQSANDEDPAAVRMSETSTAGMLLKVEEESSDGTSVDHLPEEVGYIALPVGGVLDRNGRAIGEAGRLQADHAWGVEDDWYRVDYQRSYRDPVVFMNLSTVRGGEPAHVRLRNVAPTSFEFMIEEWDYLNGSHTGETLSYLVLEKGHHALSDTSGIAVGTTQSATTTEGQTGWKNTAFPKAFSGVPVVISQVQSFADRDAVVTRQQNITPSGFDMRLQEEKANDDVHSSEVVGYLSMGQFDERLWFPPVLQSMGTVESGYSDWSRRNVVDRYYSVLDEQVQNLEVNGFVTQLDETLTLGQSLTDSQYWIASFPGKVRNQEGKEMVILVEGERGNPTSAHLKGEPHPEFPNRYNAGSLSFRTHDYRNPVSFGAIGITRSDAEDISENPFSLEIRYLKHESNQVDGMNIRVRIMTRDMRPRRCPFCFVWADEE